MVIAGLRSNLNTPTFGQWSTLVDLLSDRAIHQSQQIYRFLSDGEQDERCLTYVELDQQSRAIAAHLQSFARSSGAVVGERALLLYPPGLEFIAAFFGCLYAGVIPVPAYLPRNNRHQHRVRAIAQDAQATIVMTTSGSLASLQSTLDSDSWNQSGGKLHWIATDILSASLASSWAQPSIAGDSLALLQYTSGTTGHPKGVMVSHGNLLHNLAQIYQQFEHSASSSVFSWLPAYHDMGLIGGIFQPLYAGIPVTLMAPVHFLQKPKRWLDAIARYGITSSGGPNFAYDLCVQKIAPEQRVALDLSSWDVAFTGAEPAKLSTLELFAKTFADCGFRQQTFYPCYGLAEATLFVTGGRKGDVPSIHQSVQSVSTNSDATALQPPRVSCGKPSLSQSVLIVDPDACHLCDDGNVGEIWVNGDSVAQGYWQRPDETAKDFHGTVKGRKESFLRTGDLGFISQGELYITGRIKDVIIVRGQNHYPQDIEAAIAQAHPALRQGHGAVFSVEHPGQNGQNTQEQIVVVQEIERTWVRKLKSTELATEITDAIRSAVSQQYALQVEAIALVKPNGVPKTSSGKIQRQQCKADWLAGELKGVIKAKGMTDTVGWVEVTKPNTPAITDDALRLSPNTSYTTLPNSLPKIQNPKSKIQNVPTPKSQPLINWLRDYAEHHINSRLMNERRAIAPNVLLDFGNQGLLGMQVPESYGGLALGTLDTMQVLQQLGAIDTTLALFVGLNNILGIRPILSYGQSELKDELLPQLAIGRELAAFALTEPAAGSNPRGIQTKAALPGPDSPYAMSALISGTKIWSGSAAWASVINVFAQHQLADGTWAGISGFAVRRNSPGLRQGSEALTMGMRGMVQNTVYLEQVPVEAADLLGQVGQGMTVAQDAMMYGRLAIAAASIGGMKRCVQLMVRYSSRRSVSTGRLLDNPVTLTRLGDITKAITTVETLVHQIAQRLDQGEAIPVDAYTACKIAAPELFWQAADTLVQTLGGRGYIETNMAPQILRDARVLRIFEGPTETLEMFLGARVIHGLSSDSTSTSSPSSAPKADLWPWLRETLDVPHIADCLMDAAVQVQHGFKQCASFSHHLTGQQYASTWVGKLTTWAILWAGVENAMAQRHSDKSIASLSAQTSVQPSLQDNDSTLLSSKGLEQALLWVQQQFQSTLEQALLTASAKEGAIASSAQMLDIAATYEKSIGNIEQSSAGEDREVDPWLKRDREVDESIQEAVVKQQHSEDPLVRYASLTAPYAAPTPQRPNAPTPQLPNSLTPHNLKSVRVWLVSWLSDRLKVAPEQIDRKKSFADYGIDSVMAVELAQDLEDWLGGGTPLDVTVAWNFPTIDALAEYLSETHFSTDHEAAAHQTPDAPLRASEKSRAFVEAGSKVKSSNGSNGNSSKSNRNVSSRSSNGHGASGRGVLSTLDQATETELAQLLAAEIAKVQQRGGR